MCIRDSGSRTPIELLVRSGSRAAAGVQVPLLHALIDAGACFDGAESPPRLGPLRRALAFSFLPAARALAERGARIDSLALAAGLGDLEFARTLLGSADLAERRAAMIFAAMHGHVPLVTLLLDAGGEIDRREPDDFGNAAAPLHHAAIHGQLEVVRVLVARGADLDRRDRTSQRTAFEWAVQNEHYEVAAFLRSARGLTPS